MSLIKAGEVAMGDTSSLSVFINSEDHVLEIVKGEDEVLIQLHLTDSEAEMLSNAGIDEV